MQSLSPWEWFKPSWFANLDKDLAMSTRRPRFKCHIQHSLCKSSRCLIDIYDETSCELPTSPIISISTATVTSHQVNPGLWQPYQGISENRVLSSGLPLVPLGLCIFLKAAQASTLDRRHSVELNSQFMAAQPGAQMSVQPISIALKSYKTLLTFYRQDGGRGEDACVLPPVL